MSEVVSQEAAMLPLFRYAMCVEYDGSAYRGWQSQPGGVVCVQDFVEQGLSVVANEPVKVICAGRTDAGVHGCYQIIHVDTHAVRSDRAWVLGANTNMPYDINIRWARPVSDDFHARFSALERRYRFVIYSAPVKSALLKKQLTWTYKPLDETRMQQAADFLIGMHDFSSYRAAGCQARSPVREVRRFDVRRIGNLIVLDVSANAFLHHMIRNFAGVLMKIGAGEAEPGWAKQVLDARDRRQGGVTAQPFGLYFVDVKYPAEFALPQSELGPVFLPQFD